LFSGFGRHTALVNSTGFTFIGCLLRQGIPEDFASPRRALPAPPGLFSLIGRRGNPASIINFLANDKHSIAMFVQDPITNLQAYISAFGIKVPIARRRP